MKRARGFTYLWLLFALTLGGVALAALGERETTRQQREREAELRFRGEAIATALARYAEATPAGQLPLPQSLQELLADPRFPAPRRHLRELYADPFTGRPDWELVMAEAVPAAADGAGGAAATPARPGIAGVRSRSERRLFAERDGRRKAADWVFMSPAGTAPAAPE